MSPAPSVTVARSIPHHGRWLASIGLAALLVLSVGLLLSQPVRALGGVVINCANEAELTARLAGGGSVTFNCGNVYAPATIVFNSQKIITQDTTIDGGGVITFSGGALTRTFVVSSGSHLTLLNLAIEHGRSPTSGGAIRNDGGTLIVENVTFFSNTVGAGQAGGAIYSTGQLSMFNGRFFSNTAQSGGGLASAVALTSISSTVAINSSVFSRNRAIDNGGAISAGGDWTHIKASTFDANSAGSRGGAIDSDGPLELTVEASTFHDNIAVTNCCGAIYSSGLLTVTNVAIDNNQARTVGGLGADGPALLTNVRVYSNTAKFYGGGLSNKDRATLINVEVYSNVATFSDSSGGGIYNLGTLTITHSAIHHNLVSTSGGGVANFGQGLWLSDVDIYGNTVLGPDGWGGGLDHDNTLENPGFLDRVRIFDNRVISGSAAYAGGGLSVFYAQSPLTLTNSAVYSNIVGSGPGGGIHASYGAALTILNSAIFDNAATNGVGGGIDAGGDSGGASVQLMNSTLSGNSALAGGGLNNDVVNPPVIITNVTFFANTAINGGNLSGTVSLVNTILTGGLPDNCDSADTTTSLGHNLEDGLDCGLSAGGDLTTTDPLLDSLQGNAVLIWGHLPRPGSPAIDSADDTACPPIDQRGFQRPIGPGCDRGALEVPRMTFLPIALKNH
jgi:predicted outer membrane repeat protein